ncbi:MAG TPA: GYD domain-containing protein [Gemmatimonadaceae bacterium]|nr:GYD domain-containing protein [Gemmatimonadaceae bacterium]
MPIYLWRASYSAEGAKRLLKDGGTKRRVAIQQLVDSAGGKLHAYYYSFGESDVCAIAEFPDAATAAAVSLAVNSSGFAQVQTTVLITAEDVDAASKKSVVYRPPGT